MTERMKKLLLKRSSLVLKNSVFIVFGSARRGYFRNCFEMIRCVFVSKVVNRARSSALFTKLKKLRP